MLNTETPFLIASSVFASEQGDQKFSLTRTIELASGKADGTQLYVNPERFSTGIEDVGFIRDRLAQNNLLTNIVHLPGYAVPEDLRGESGKAISLGVKLVDPVEGVGKLLVIHHNPYSGLSDQHILDSVAEAVDLSHDPSIAIGLEHFHPFDLTTQENLGEQVDRYLSLLKRLQEVVPAYAVFDTCRFYSSNNANIPPAPLFDEGDQLLKKMLDSLRGQKILVHFTDKKDMGRSGREKGNAVPLGRGVFTPVYEGLSKLGREYRIEWIAAVDETEDVDAISDSEVVKRMFSNDKLPAVLEREGKFGEIIDESEKVVRLPGTVREMNPARILIEAIGTMYPYSPGNLVAQVVLPYLAEEKYRGWAISYGGFDSSKDRGIVNLTSEEIAAEVRKILAALPDGDREELLHRLRMLGNSSSDHIKDFLSKPEGYWGP